ncbi:Piso0_001852 [Millerozyma farinosa CBS 7064]|uniref:Piso0_001852 protein n=1 Tax=Pichia sorbitophila (strain ATCC MYA-4447 / BCRC 22081 / CBS 7064 / NBRC 10061 / NRRL Y-12695) TaxID=559304 RepID=G8YP96_PICSO|nr:Piso0_001852 [Millerozyma farinosa CBS 7064]
MFNSQRPMWYQNSVGSAHVYRVERALGGDMSTNAEKRQSEGGRAEKRAKRLDKVSPRMDFASNGPIMAINNSVYGAQYNPIMYQPEFRHQKGAVGGKRGRGGGSFARSSTERLGGNRDRARGDQSPSRHVVNIGIQELDNSVPEDMRRAIEPLYQQIERKKYSTSAIDPNRNYLTVYEYPVNNQWIIWDYETSLVHLTGIWKASFIDESSGSKSVKADIMKLLESTPKQYHSNIKRIRGGYLKIQGTWMPYGLCKVLARRFCYHIRYELIPLFGVSFPSECLRPDEKGFGELKLADSADAVGVREEPVILRPQHSSMPYLMDPPELKETQPKPNLKAEKPHPLLTNVQGLSETSHWSPSSTWRNATNSSISPEAYTVHTDSPFSSFPYSGVYLSPYPIQSHVPNKSALPPVYSLNFTDPSPNMQPSTPQNPETRRRSVMDIRPHKTEGELSDVFSASKCLQSLSNSQFSPISYNLTPNRNYVTFNKTNSSPSIYSQNGISSILLAAGVSDHDGPVKTPKSNTMKIDNLLS